MPAFRKILLVDDDEASNFLTQLLLKKAGVTSEVNVTANGREALAFLQQCREGQSPDLILLDINMPLMNGFEFLEQFQQLPVAAGTRVVLLSSSVSDKDLEAASRFRISEFINKPLTRERLQQLLQ